MPKKEILGLTHKGPKHLYFDALSDITVVLDMRQSIPKSRILSTYLRKKKESTEKKALPTAWKPNLLAKLKPVMRFSALKKNEKVVIIR